jgi:demethylmenaquinone methyltransferase/2-methoxy-6-polyprenyl-1,4-benzoquinol methylase
MFDRVAPRYDLLNRLLSARQDQRWRRRLVAMVPYRPGGRFADIATGTGDVLLAVAKGRPEYGAFVGVDLSREMLAAAKPKLAAAGVTAELRQESAEALSLPSASFDAAAISFGLRNVVRKEKALSEFHRILAPGGTLLILEFFLPRRGPLAWLFQLYFHKILPLIGALLSDREAYRYLPESVGSFYSVAGLRAALYDGGFTVEAIESFLFGACRLVRATRGAAPARRQDAVQTSST